MNKRIGVYPGTFDPITLGHVDIIKRACNLVDELIIAVAEDVQKETIFPIPVRAEMIKREMQDQDVSCIIRVEVFRGLLMHFAKSQGALMIIRGLRAVSDFDYEFQMSWINYRLLPGIETIFLPASEDTQFISSSFVKEVARLGGNVDAFVSKNVSDNLKLFYSSS